MIPTSLDVKPFFDFITSADALEHLQLLVGGFIQSLSYLKDPKLLLIVNEDGLHKQLGQNYNILKKTGYQLVGPVVIVQIKETEEGQVETSLDDKITLENWLTFFQSD